MLGTTSPPKVAPLRRQHRAHIRRSRPRFARVRAKVYRFCEELGQCVLATTSRRVRTSVQLFGLEVQPDMFGRTLGPSVVNFGRCLVERGPSLANIGQSLAKLSGAKCVLRVQIWWNSGKGARIRRSSTEFPKKTVNFGQLRPMLVKFGQIRSNSTKPRRNRPSLVDFDKARSNIAQIWWNTF